MEIASEPLYFDTDSPHVKLIKSLIKSQANEVCRNTLNGEIIHDAVKNLDFGYARIALKAAIGQHRSSPTSKYYLQSTIMCKKDPVAPNVLSIDLVCSRPSVRDGKLLMAMVESKAIELNYHTLTLFAIGHDDLLSWYKRLGFTVNKIIYTNTAEIKAYSLYKKLSSI